MERPVLVILADPPPLSFAHIMNERTGYNKITQ